MGKTEKVRRRVVNRVDGGRAGVISAIWPWTRCSAFWMSTSQRKNTLISVEPRPVTERRSVMPGTRRIACSIGRVTVSIWMSTGAMPFSARIEIRGKSVCGKIATGRPSANTTPARAKLKTTSRRARPWASTNEPRRSLTSRPGPGLAGCRPTVRPLRRAARSYPPRRRRLRLSSRCRISILPSTTRPPSTSLRWAIFAASTTNTTPLCDPSSSCTAPWGTTTLFRA